MGRTYGRSCLSGQNRPFVPVRYNLCQTLAASQASCHLLTHLPGLSDNAPRFRGLAAGPRHHNCNGFSKNPYYLLSPATIQDNRYFNFDVTKNIYINPLISSSDIPVDFIIKSIEIPFDNKFSFIFIKIKITNLIIDFKILSILIPSNPLIKKLSTRFAYISI